MPARGDYCPITVGVDVLGDRWTPLVIRELMVGASGFHEISRGLPRMSRTLLARRLRQLERQGLVRRGETGPGRPACYTLTPAGEGLTPIVRALGQWAAEWVFGDPTAEDCDGLSLLWRMHQHAVPDALPERRAVVLVQLTGDGAAQGWLDIDRRAMSVCRDDPGSTATSPSRPPPATCTAGSSGWCRSAGSRRPGSARLLGPAALTRAFPTWFDTTLFAEGLSRREALGSTALAPT
ncbi:winged helix-turn-helix transcriptional regulator [Motilibacter aurantiacus]|uniref:winged helix-turn-helix transcriptional regulator n=1 Tax=Motilibacter aurantiacus TaxID=2714955 RepID=UPI001E49A2A6|nr:helix-turn-helix domain-containing protein [Motilibacter aurantiacus]